MKATDGTKVAVRCSAGHETIVRFLTTPCPTASIFDRETSLSTLLGCTGRSILEENRVWQEFGAVFQLINENVDIQKP